ncbi:hypothetical protein DPMN_087281 [Dreissena polymorpha]|uniref:Uncharacterized protein n=1 Tax=Dreissena polymorpha TaxID=45954 RepID=A0A9D4QW79_DREPO|nr:hypothetical protein DPMN_087281 [Dreissena polymorpha]
MWSRASTTQTSQTKARGWKRWKALPNLASILTTTNERVQRSEPGPVKREQLSSAEEYLEIQRDLNNH